jgi:Mrp family chromosome partitioning ATPase
MSSPSTQVAPSKLASIQAFVSRAGFFWRGGAVVLFIVFGGSLALAMAVGDVYESESLVELAEAPSPQDRPADAPTESAEQQLRAALSDPASTEQLAREMGPAPLAGPALEAAAVRVRRAIDVRARGDRRFAIAFRASTPGAAQHGSDSLAQSAMRVLERSTDPASEEALRRVKTLEDRTKELAAFVAEHPEVAVNPAPSASAAGVASAPAPVDTALVVLQQQRAALEWRIADAQKKEAAGVANPYDTDRASLQRTLAQVRAAIAARQAMSLRAGAEGSSGARASGSTSRVSQALQTEWQRLVQAVVDAQAQVPAKREASSSGPRLRIVQRASLPFRPLKPDKRLICLLGMAGGVWSGILWAFARVALGHDLVDVVEEHEPETETMVDGDADAPLPQQPPGWTAMDALDEPALPTDAADASPVTAKDGGGWQLVQTGFKAMPSKPPGASGSRFPKELLSTAPGVVDAARVLAQTGSMPNPPAKIQVVPIVDVGRRGESPGAVPEAATEARPGSYAYQQSSPAPADTAPARPTGNEPTFANAPVVVPAPVIVEQPRQPSAPPNAVPHSPPYVNRDAAIRIAGVTTQSFSSPITGVTQTFASPVAGASRGGPPIAPAPVGASAQGMPRQAAFGGSQVAPGDEASPQKRSSPPAGTYDVQAQAVPPQYGLALRSKPPEDMLSLRDVPLGWSPDPSMMQTGSMQELLTLRDQIYKLAAKGCFVVGVTSGSKGKTDKSNVAAQLASVVAGPGKARVLLLEANFDEPAVHRLMRIDMPFSHGFSEQIRKRMNAPSHMPWVLFRCAPNLHVMGEGLMRSPGLLSSVQFGEALAEFRRYYDVIVADGPIAASTIDTVAFDAMMDGIVVVGAVGSVPGKLLEDAAKYFGKKQMMAVISADASAEHRIEFGPQRA